MSDTPTKNDPILDNRDPVLACRMSPGSPSSFDNMVHQATTSVLNNGNSNQGKVLSNIMAKSMGKGEMPEAPYTPTAREEPKNDSYISPVETFSPNNENDMTMNPEENVVAKSNGTCGVGVTVPVCCDTFEFMSPSLAVNKSITGENTNEGPATEPKEDPAIVKSNSDSTTPTESGSGSESNEKLGISKSISTCPTGASKDANEEGEEVEDDLPGESNMDICRRRPVWLWVFVFCVIALAIGIVAYVGKGMVDEKSQKDSATATWDAIAETNAPSDIPTKSPSEAPSGSPTEEHSESPTTTVRPSATPSLRPSQAPTRIPSVSPTNFPTVSSAPSDIPSSVPSDYPSTVPSYAPTDMPSDIPSDVPSTVPSVAPTDMPSVSPTNYPTVSMAPSLSMAPTMEAHNLLTDLLNNITDTPLEVLSNPETPQGRALLWMATEDQVVFNLLNNQDTEAAMLTIPAESALVADSPSISPEALYGLSQRFALVTLDISVHANSDILWSFPDKHECEWPGITCDRSEEIIAINWARQDLKGYVAPEISLLTVLEKLDLAQNQLTGFVDVFWNLPSLKTLYVFDNNFMGSISTEIGNMYQLEQLYMNNNDLTGSIPEELWDLDDLRYLILRQNGLTGTLPDRIRLNDLYYWDLSMNSLNGTLPSTLQMVSLRHFDLSYNEFSGTIPEDYSDLGSNRLFQFYLNDNKITGEFPGNWHTKLPHKWLTNVDISNNRLTEKLPGSVCMLSVYEEGETIEFRADCDVCNCKNLCYRWCDKNSKEFHNY